MALEKDGFNDDSPAAAVTECQYLGHDGNWVFLLGDVKFLGHSLLCWFGGQERSVGRLAVCWCMTSLPSCSGNMLQNDIKFVIMRHRR